MRPSPRTARAIEEKQNYDTTIAPADVTRAPVEDVSTTPCPRMRNRNGLSIAGLRVREMKIADRNR